MQQDDRVQSLARAVLSLVPFDGWSLRALMRAAREDGLSAQEALILFPRGVQDVVRVLNQSFDAQMLTACPADDLEQMRVRERIAALVMARLMVMEPHRLAVKCGLSWFALPDRNFDAAQVLYRTLDAIWIAAGDRSDDYNFYSKRMILAVVYSTTLLYWLDDSSPDYEQTRAFLSRRIADSLKIGGKVGGAFGQVAANVGLFSKRLKAFSPLQFVFPCTGVRNV